jgi:hypothetical protein
MKNRKKFWAGSLSVMMLLACMAFQRAKPLHMVIRVINNNITEGDKPAFSLFPDGRDMQELPLGDTIDLTLRYSKKAKLYLWTCPKGDNSCVWKPYNVPAKHSHSKTYDELDPFHRKLTIIHVRDIVPRVLDL